VLGIVILHFRGESKCVFGQWPRDQATHIHAAVTVAHWDDDDIGTVAEPWVAFEVMSIKSSDGRCEVCQEECV